MTFNNANGKIMESGPGGWVKNPCNVIILTAVPPSTAATEERIGTLGIYPTTGAAYLVVNNTGINGTVTWAELALSTGAVATLTPDTGTTPTVPTAGTITLAGTANQILTTGGANKITFSLIGPYTPAT